MTERLTIKRNNGDCVLKAESCCYGWYSFDVQESLRKEGTEILKKAIYKLAEYETAEDEGRLVVLPCKVGTRVYEIYQFCGCGAWEIEEHKIKLEDLDKIGKTVFPTREEAEKALKEMEKDDAAN